MVMSWTGARDVFPHLTPLQHRSFLMRDIIMQHKHNLEMKHRNGGLEESVCMFVCVCVCVCYMGLYSAVAAHRNVKFLWMT